MSSFRPTRIAAYAAVLLFLSFSAQAQIRVAVEDGSPSGTGADIVSQLNDDTWVNFTAVKVSAADIDSLAELANYDVVILGDSGTRDHDWTSDMSNALRDWVNAGGSAVLTGWGSYGMNTSNAIFDPLDEIFPTQNIASTNEFDSSATLMNILQPAHPIFTGLVDFSFPSGCCTELNPLPLELGDVELARMEGSPTAGTVVAVKPVGSGVTVYLGPVYMGDTGYYVAGLRSGNPDRLLEQAVSWAATGSVISPETVPVPGLTIPGLILLALGLLFISYRRFA